MEREGAPQMKFKMKFKGILKNRTFFKLLYHSGDFFNGKFDELTNKPVFLPSGSVRYSTRKADFYACRRSVKYWEIWQVIGRV